MTDDQVADVRILIAALEYVSDGYAGEYGERLSPEAAVESCAPPEGFVAYMRLKALMAERGLTTSHEWSW